MARRGGLYRPTEEDAERSSGGDPYRNRSIPERRGENPSLQEYQMSGEMLPTYSPSRGNRIPRRILDWEFSLRKPESPSFPSRSRRSMGRNFSAASGAIPGVGREAFPSFGYSRILSSPTPKRPRNIHGNPTSRPKDSKGPHSRLNPPPPSQLGDYGLQPPTQVIWIPSNIPCFSATREKLGI